LSAFSSLYNRKRDQLRRFAQRNPISYSNQKTIRYTEPMISTLPYIRGDDLHIRWLGHATVLMRQRSVTLMTDPIFRSKLFYLRRHGGDMFHRVSDNSTPLLILISHLHHDHLDFASLRRLNHDAVIVAPAGVRSYLMRRLPQNVIELGIGEEFRFQHLRIVGVHAEHGGRRWPSVSAEAQGYLIDAGQTIYFAGDTGLYPAMESLRSREIDIALLPVCGHSPRLGKNHMNPLEAARALEYIDAKIAVPIHWGTYRPVGFARHHFLKTPPYEFASHAALWASGTQVHVLNPGDDLLVAGSLFSAA